MQRIVLLLLNLLVSLSLTAQPTDGLKKEYFQSTAVKFGLASTDLMDYVVSNNYVTNSTGIRHIYLQQRFQGIRIYNAIMGLHISAEGELVYSTSSFVGRLQSRINNTNAGISPESALLSAARHLNLPGPSNVKVMKPGMFNDAGISQEDIPHSLIYQLVDDGRLILCWGLVIKDINSADWWDIRVDANTGQVVDKTNWTVSCSWEHGGFENREHSHYTAKKETFVLSANTHNTADFQNPDSYNVYPLGTESPNHGMRTVVMNPADVSASPFGWHDTTGTAGAEFTITRGNNVYAYEDRNNVNLPGSSPDGGIDLKFDFPLDFSQHPVVNESAIITNLFYWNNIMHDIWYHYGFDEASGNFQSNNYGNGGLGNDYVLAEAQDGSGFNNANFSSPPDGSLPRMQMFLWSGSTVVNVTVNSPVNLTLQDGAVIANFGPSHFNVTGDLVLVNDGSGSPTLGCSTLTNGAALSGNIAVIDRGGCEFSAKALNAQNAGAVAVIVINNVAGAPTVMGPGTYGGSVTIPAMMISQADGQAISNLLPGVNLTLQYAEAVTDSDLDNGIIAHEYGHGISIRLTGGPALASCLSNQEQMGEGWSDWFGLMLTMNPSDVGTNGRGIGTYVLDEPTTGNGIRPHPYSTDMVTNPHTYDAIKSAAVPHGVGSVWCAMIWEMTWLLIDEYGFDPDLYSGTGGNNLAMHLVMEGLRLQVCNPGFVDGRNAILTADQLLYGGANQCLIWKAFAKRGLGFSASQGSSDNVLDGVEAFDLPPSCNLSVTKTVDKLLAGGGDMLIYSINVTNLSEVPVTNVIATDEIPANTAYVTGSASDGGSLVGGSVVFPATTLVAGQSDTYTFKVTIDPGIDTSLYTTLEDAESMTDDWKTMATNPGLGNWSITNSNPHAGTGVWFAPDVPSPNDQYLVLSDPIMPGNTTELKFWHSYDTEATWDGGLVQVSVNNQFSWQDLGAFITQNGYNSTIDENALTPAFSGTSGGYIESIVDLSSFSDQVISIRFWMHCDDLVGGDGWYIDNIELTNLNVIIPNTVLVSADGLSEIVATLVTPTRVSETCLDNLIFTNTFNNIIQEYRANVQIQSSSVISGNSDLYFIAADNLQFNSGFEIQLGSSFLADIGLCADPPILNNPGVSLQTSNTVKVIN